jgi:glycosyltransferase involved in cell wall biosynthesis
MKIVWAGTFEPEFSRNRKLARLLDLCGDEVSVVREQLWGGDRVDLARSGSMRTALAAMVKYPKLVARLLAAGRPDLYLVSYPGWFDMPIVSLVARIKRRPVVFDPFISLFDTMISDRRLHGERSRIARIAAFFDRWSLHLADVVLADTPAHIDLYESLSPGVEEKGSVLPIGADDDLFTPRGDVEIEQRLVAFHGTFVPLQGLATIVEAAALLEPVGIQILIIGDGQDRPAVMEAIERTGASVQLTGLLPLHELPRQLAKAAVCLGVFGESEKAGRVVPHKLYECLALGRPVVTRDGPAIRSMFKPGEVLTVPAGDPVSLANVIKSLIEDPVQREQVARAGLVAYRERFHEHALAQLLARAFESATD